MKIQYALLAGVFSATAVLPLIFQTISQAQSITCEPSETNISFADGNNLSEMCIDQGSGMTFEPSSETYVEGVVDPNNTY